MAHSALVTLTVFAGLAWFGRLATDDCMPGRRAHPAWCWTLFALFAVLMSASVGAR